MTARARTRTLATMCAPLLLACGSTLGTIGAVLGQRSDGHLFIREVPEDLAAAEQGLRPDDEVLLIDGIDVRRLDEQRVHSLLIGEVGSPVKLTVIRDQEVIRVSLRRTAARPHAITGSVP